MTRTPPSRIRPAFGRLLRVIIRLLAIDGPDKGKVYDVTGRGTFQFGREGVVESKGELPEDPYCSRIHALLEAAGPIFLVSDIGSRNGTFVNGTRLTRDAPRELQHGDQLKAGRTTLRVELIPDPAPPTPAPPPPAAPMKEPGDRAENPPPNEPRVVAPAAPDVPRRGDVTVQLRGKGAPEPPAKPTTPASAIADKDVRIKLPRADAPAAPSAPADGPGLNSSSSRDRTIVLPPRDERAKRAADEAKAPPPRDLSRPITDFSRGMKIGEGGASIVYRGIDNRGGAPVAIKFMHPRKDLPPEAVALFLRELDIHAAIVHPNIVGVVARGQASDGKPWLVLEFVDGGDLGERVNSTGPISAEDAVRFGDAVLSALAYAHGLGFVHRDVKPANVLLKGPPPLTALLADFGIAKSMQSVGAATMTETGVLRGTVEYMAPEQLEDSKRVGPPADVYGAAATLYFALTGECHLDGPLDGYPGFHTVLAETTKRVPLADRRPGLPASLCAAIDRGLAHKAADRFATADEFRRALAGKGR
jgi:eukaryotic-like serine/threonine-protein kinase